MAANDTHKVADMVDKKSMHFFSILCFFAYLGFRLRILEKLLESEYIYSNIKITLFILFLFIKLENEELCCFQYLVMFWFQEKSKKKVYIDAEVCTRKIWFKT